MEITEDKEKYEFVKNVLNEVRYRKLKRKEKRTVQRYLKFLTGYSKGHIKTLLLKWKKGQLYWNLYSSLSPTHYSYKF
jgi:hypothetical protein